MRNKQFKELFYLTKEVVEENCYTFDEGMKHAYCKVCHEETGAGAYYNHKNDCKIERLTNLLEILLNGD
jgi:hypothetical protein